MTKIKRLLNSYESNITVIPPITQQELKQRSIDYETLTPKKMRTKYSDKVYEPVIVNLKDKKFLIQFNFCTNPYCKNFNLPQEKFNIKGKSNRYKLIGKDRSKVVSCNPDKVNSDAIPTLGCYSKTLSNWSIADEIERLIRINTTTPLETDYEFHKKGCSTTESYFDNSKKFHKRGYSTANALKVQCKECKKLTNLLPTKQQTTGFNQKRNDILPQFAKMLTNRIPVTSVCDVLGIGRKTYYSKLEWLYRCCLEFLETREKAFEKKIFPHIWLNTDSMIYHLNNVRKKGERRKGHSLIEQQLPTSIVTTTDLHSRYVFRSDVNFDWDINFEKIHFDTKVYKDDHLNDYVSKNGRFTKYFAHPMEPTKIDDETYSEYREKMNEISERQKYIEGLHTNPTYTTSAHLWLIKQQVKASKWCFISDEDKSIITAYQRIFAEEINDRKAHQFLCKVNKTLSRNDAYVEYKDSIKFLKLWAKHKGLEYSSLSEVALWVLTDDVRRHDFWKTLHTPLGEVYRKYNKNQIEHPIALRDRGKRILDVLTDASYLTPEQLARLFLELNDNAVNIFLQEIRRSISILERPLVTSRGDGKSYIYANFNPRYAQMSVTILRTYYNFCKETEKNGIKKTPAQRLGIADKVYSWEDIIYKR